MRYMIINVNDKIPLFDRYNGGWIKTVYRVDKDYKNGYSLVGDFLPVSSGNIDLSEDTLYLDCSISGSRKHPERDYTLFKIIDGEVFIIKEIENGGRDWAMSLWETVEKELDCVDPYESLKKKLEKMDYKEFLKFFEHLRTNDKRFQMYLSLVEQYPDGIVFDQ